MADRVTVRAWIIPLEPGPDSPCKTCPTCGFDSLLLFPVYCLTVQGVTKLPRTFPLCGRCADTPNR